MGKNETLGICSRDGAVSHLTVDRVDVGIRQQYRNRGRATFTCLLARWLNEPTFSAAYRQAQSELFETALTTLQAASGDAVRCLRAIVNDQQAQASVRVSAAKS